MPRYMKVDALSRLAILDCANLCKIVLIEELVKSIIEEAEACQVNHEPSWLDLIISYLKDGQFPIDQKEARMVIFKSA